jgi:hypothetical protein
MTATETQTATEAEVLAKRAIYVDMAARFAQRTIHPNAQDREAVLRGARLAYLGALVAGVDCINAAHADVEEFRKALNRFLETLNQCADIAIKTSEQTGGQ